MGSVCGQHFTGRHQQSGDAAQRQSSGDRRGTAAQRQRQRFTRRKDRHFARSAVEPTGAGDRADLDPHLCRHSRRRQLALRLQSHRPKKVGHQQKFWVSKNQVNRYRDDQQNESCQVIVCYIGATGAVTTCLWTPRVTVAS